MYSTSYTDKDTNPKTGKYTVVSWIEEWFEDVAKLKVHSSSHQTYRGYIDHHIAPNMGKIPLEKLSAMDFQELYRKLINKGSVERVEAEHQPKGLSAKTVRNINQVISSAKDFAVAQKIILENPCKAVALPKVAHKEMQTIPAERPTPGRSMLFGGILLNVLPMSRTN